ncbi:HlyD family efflux transporter periplasmic adaptor subunit [Clostridiaceae bacterium M8S5]|nr:HlyD family efflux transporter periplasmic adaptor subunit [Clostridiaceae bacterium M8S5]
MKKKYIVIILAVIIIGFFGYKKFSNKAVSSEVFQVQTYQVSRGDIQTSITGNGNIESSILKELKSKNAASIEAIYAKVGEKVNKDDIIVKLKSENNNSSNIVDRRFEIDKSQRDLDKLKKKIDLLTLKSPYSGIITKLYVEKGEEVGQGKAIVRIVNKEYLRLTVPFGKHVVDKMTVGMKGKIYLPTYMQTIAAEVVDINKDPNSTSSGAITCNVTLETKNIGALTENTKARGTVLLNGAEITSADVGTLKWKVNRDVKVETSGEISQINIKEGQRVNKGDIIAKLTNADLSDQINMNERRISNERRKLGELSKNDKSAINSPITGTIVAMNVVSGENITVGQTLGKVADLESFGIKMNVDESDVLKVKEGQKAIIKVAALKDVQYEGIVDSVSYEGKVNNGTAEYIVSLKLTKNENMNMLRLGMSANAEIILQSKKGVLLVPKQYVKKDEKGYYVMVQKNGDKSEKVYVKVGLVDNDKSEIISNLKEGDILVNE